MKQNIGILFPNQLFETIPFADTVKKIYLLEEFLFFKQFNFHKQKIAFHRASMKAHEAVLISKGFEVKYIESTGTDSDIRNLLDSLKQEDTEICIHYIDPTDVWLSRSINKGQDGFKSSFIRYENPSFLSTVEDLSSFFKKDKKSFFQTTFYKQQRKKWNVLLEEDGSPQGGKWTFDTENRKKYPKGKTPPVVFYPDPSAEWKEAVDYVATHFPNNLGSVGATPIYPTTQKDAHTWFEQFLVYRFHEFGAYEDAIVKEELILNHSILSPLINSGLLLPQYVVEKALEFAEKENVPINSTEGFVRQIIGWREFIRGMYHCKGNISRTTNFFGFDKKIPQSFYDGTTGIVPIDSVIKKTLQTGYCHHIERLMVLGNFMLLCEFDPDEVYRWFMELFIDAYDWVMVPNVYGMSQFSDGGFFATKPYVAGSNYLKKMSDYPKGEWQATWDGLFWRFLNKHQDFFKKNPRSSMLINTFNRMSEEKKLSHLDNAEAFLKNL